MVDRAARALDVEREDVAGDVAGDVDRVVAEPADHARRDAGRGREDVDRVVALERVDLEHLDVRVGDRDADAVDRLVDVTTMWSAYSVPRMTSLSKPLPPSTETGAFMLYSTWFVPAPVRMSLSAAVEKPLVSFGIAIWSCALIQTISQSARWLGSRVVRVAVGARSGRRRASSSARARSRGR